MNVIWEDIFSDVPSTIHLARVFVRLVCALVLGGILGLERLREHKSAGLRTHMMVALGAALFTLVPLEAGMQLHDLSRVIQGVATGIGFLGAGTIIKVEDQHRIEGLTSAASIWVTAAVGMAIGAGWLWASIMGVVLGWTVLSTVHGLERRLRQRANRK